MEILGVKIDKINLAEAIDKFNSWFNEPGQHLVVTVNPEFVVAAQRNGDFKRVLNSADLATADGSGIVWAGKLLHNEKLTRVTGVDLSEQILNGKCPEAKIYLLGGENGAAEALRTQFVFSQIVGAESGGKLLKDKNELEDNETVLRKINDSGANLLLVAFGQVRQEMWLANNLPKLQNIKIGIGIGGTFDYLSGRVKRPPVMIRKLGLEWLYRLIIQPKRWRRIYNATVVFGWLVIKKILTNSNELII